MFKWYEYSGEIWSIENNKSQNHIHTVLEQEKPRPVIIYNSNGEPLTQPKQKLGFDLTIK